MLQKFRSWLWHNTCHIANSETCTFNNKPHHDEFLKPFDEWWQHSVSPLFKSTLSWVYELAVTNTFNNGVFYVSFASCLIMTNKSNLSSNQFQIIFCWHGCFYLHNLLNSEMFVFHVLEIASNNINIVERVKTTKIMLMSIIRIQDKIIE